MARKRARGKAGTRRTPRKRVKRARSRSAARAKRSVRRTRPKRAAAKTRAKAKRPARKPVAAKRVAARRKPAAATSTIGQVSPGAYAPPQPITPLEPMRHDPWERPVEHHTENTGMDEEEEEEEPL